MEVSRLALKVAAGGLWMKLCFGVTLWNRFELDLLNFNWLFLLLVSWLESILLLSTFCEYFFIKIGLGMACKMSSFSVPWAFYLRLLGKVILLTWNILFRQTNSLILSKVFIKVHYFLYVNFFNSWKKYLERLVELQCFSAMKINL